MLDLQGFELYLMREERSENTIACYLRDVRAFLVWYGDADLRMLSELDLIRYKKYLNAKERTVITANRTNPITHGPPSRRAFFIFGGSS